MKLLADALQAEMQMHAHRLEQLRKHAGQLHTAEQLQEELRQLGLPIEELRAHWDQWPAHPFECANASAGYAYRDPGSLVITVGVSSLYAASVKDALRALGWNEAPLARQGRLAYYHSGDPETRLHLCIRFREVRMHALQVGESA